VPERKEKEAKRKESFLFVPLFVTFRDETQRPNRNAPFLIDFNQSICKMNKQRRTVSRQPRQSKRNQNPNRERKSESQIPMMFSVLSGKIVLSAILPILRPSTNGTGKEKPFAISRRFVRVSLIWTRRKMS